MKAQGKIQGVGPNLELPEVRSRKELLRKMQINCEKMATNECTTNAPTVVTHRKVNFPNFKVRDQTK